MKKVKSKNNEIIEQISNVDCAEEVRKSMLDYSYETIDRAIPDVRDGLKPVHRRILYTMMTEGNTFNKPYKKCVKAVGSTLGRFHPHGDTSVYDALVRMSQDFKMNLPLIDLHGNGGSIDGDSWAAMRYTESRLAECSDYMLRDLDKKIVDEIDNFDGEEKEPVVLPAKFPNLLINGTQGLAVGMASNIPSHNIKNVLEAYELYLDKKVLKTKKDATVEELFDILKGPDFCTGGIITNKDELIKLYQTGEGAVTVRAKTHFEKGDAGKTLIIVDEIPVSSAGNKQGLVQKIIDMVINKTFPEINNIQDESSKEGIRISIEVKKGYNAENVLNKLFQKTPLQNTEHYNFLITYNKKPMIINLTQYFDYYYEFNKSFLKRKYQYLIKQIEDRLEIVEGLLTAINNLDVVIEVARYHKTKADMLDCLMNGHVSNINFKHKEYKEIAKTFHFTERQATAIRALRLDQLSNLEKNKLKDEKNDLSTKKAEYEKTISSEKNLVKVIKKDIQEFKSKYSKVRKTKIENLKLKKVIEEKKIESLIFLMNKMNYIKTVSDNETNNNSEELKKYHFVIKTTSDDKICFFTSDGMMHQLKVEDINSGKLTDKGSPIENSIGVNSYIICAFSLREILDSKLLFHTKNGFVKFVDGSEFSVKTKSSKATKLKNNDEIIDIVKFDKTNSKVNDKAKKDKKDKKDGKNDFIFCVTNSNKYLKYKLQEIPTQKKNAVGVISVRLAENNSYDSNFENEIVKSIYINSYPENLNENQIKKIKSKKRGTVPQ